MVRKTVSQSAREGALAAQTTEVLLKILQPPPHPSRLTYSLASDGGGVAPRLGVWSGAGASTREV